METLSGVVVKILFQNEQTGYAVCTIKINFSDETNKKYQQRLISNILTVVANYEIIPVVGEEIEFSGEFVENKYGIQLKASSYKKSVPNTEIGIINYLASDMFYGVGITLAKRIYDKLGNNCLDLIRKDKNVLKQLGLKEKLIDSIYSVLIENQKLESLVLSFMNLGFTKAMSIKIVNQLSSTKTEEVLNNPYLLIDYVEGLGFLRVDKIALNNGISKNDPRRLTACLLYVLTNHCFDSGNTYIEYYNLSKMFYEMIESNSFDEIYQNSISEIELEPIKDQENLFKTCVDTLVNSSKIFIDENNFVYLTSLYEDELMLSTLIKENLKTQAFVEFTYCKDDSITYTPLQLQAIETALKEKITLITGGPGTGKTTIIKGILNSITKNMNRDYLVSEVALLAPTGRAAKRMSELCHVNSQTIHRFLGYDGFRYAYNQSNKKELKMVIIDEMSMVDVSLATKLMQALYAHTKIVFVGDVDQIPSIGPGEVLFDLINSNHPEIHITKLDTIHRQAADSSIITLSHQINLGQVPRNILEKQKDRSFIKCSNESIISSLEEVINKAIDKGMTILKDIQILIPMYKGMNGIDNVNNRLQDLLNPKVDTEVVHFNQKFRINDKVIQLVNRHQDNIMNGDIGFIHSFKYELDQIVGIIVQYEANQVTYLKEEYDQIKLAYAISIHKSQGSEFKCVIIPLSKSYYTMLKRKLYYTAITRAKTFLIMIGEPYCLDIACRSNTSKRKTRLIDYLQEELPKVNPYDFM